MSAATTKELRLNRYQLDWITGHLKDVEDSSVYLNLTKFEIETNLGDSTHFTVKQFSDGDGDVIPHVVIRVPA